MTVYILTDKISSIDISEPEFNGNNHSFSTTYHLIDGSIIKIIYNGLEQDITNRQSLEEYIINDTIFNKKKSHIMYEGMLLSHDNSVNEYIINL